jgi:S1-C subfamily serine protease
VAAIGSPFGEAGSLSVGVVSQLGRQIPTPAGVCFATTGAIQTDAAINHGNSGGPLFDAAGRVIGINAQIDSSGAGSSGVGFAIPIDEARRSLAALAAGHQTAYAWLGVSTSLALSPSLVRTFHLPTAAGALVDGVAPGGPAARAGLSDGGRRTSWEGVVIHPAGDIVVGLGRSRIRTLADLQRAVAAHQPGDVVQLRYYRAGKLQRVDVTLAKRPLAPSGGCGSLH